MRACVHACVSVHACVFVCVRVRVCESDGVGSHTECPEQSRTMAELYRLGLCRGSSGGVPLGSSLLL